MRVQGTPLLKLKHRSPLLGPEEDSVDLGQGGQICYMTRAASGLTKYGFWDTSKSD